MTLLTAGALTGPHLPATASNGCTTDVRLGGVGRVPPPNKNPAVNIHGRIFFIHASFKNDRSPQELDISMHKRKAIAVFGITASFLVIVHYQSVH